MIKFKSPVTVVTSSETFTELNYILIDDSQKQVVQVRFKGIPVPLNVWSGASYVAAGDYTQAQLDAAIEAALGDNPSESLAKLFVTPRNTNTVEPSRRNINNDTTK